MSGESPASLFVPLPEVGQLLEGKYRIERLIGRGGMGAVFQARHEVLAQPVAIKFLLPEVSASSAAVARFLNEARAAAQIHNDHVARVLDVVQLPGGGAFMVLEYLEGLDLATLVANQGPLSIPDAVGYLLQSLEAIAQAHAVGIVHRDLKPANLFLAHRPDGTVCVKVLDFGISKCGPSTSLTATNAMLGSPSFMSPEQVRSPKSVDARSDLWSAGICLYHLLTRDLPYKGDTAGEVFAAILEQIPLPPRYLVPSIPPELEQVIMKCLQQHPQDRYLNVGELAAALAPFANESDRGAVDRIRHTLTGSVRMALPAPVPAPTGPGVTSMPVRLTSSPPPALPVYRRLSKPDLSKQEPYQAEKTSFPVEPTPSPASAAPAPETGPTPAPAPPSPQLGDEAPTSRTDVRKRQQPSTPSRQPASRPAERAAAAPVSASPASAEPQPSAAASKPSPSLPAAVPVAPEPSPADDAAARKSSSSLRAAVPGTPAPAPVASESASAADAPAPALLLEVAGVATEPALPAFKRPQSLDLPKREDSAADEEKEEGEADTEQLDSPFAPKLELAPAKRPSAAAAKPASLADADEETELTSESEQDLEADGKPTERLGSDGLPAAAMGEEQTAIKPPKPMALQRSSASEKLMTLLGILFLLAALALGGFLVYKRVVVPRSQPPAVEQPAPATAPQ